MSRVRVVTVRLLAAALAAAPAAAWACGGLFCNTSQPVNQAAERVLFAVDEQGGQIEMHVRITYTGPPSEFGWLLPVPPGVETTLSSEQLFQLLDAQFGPRFVLQTQFEEGCQVPLAAADGAPGGRGAEEGGGGVQVLSREAVGPYDRAILEAESVEDLRRWLDENEYQIPDDTDPKLRPYIDAGAVFVAIKLLPGNDQGDIVPLRLTFPGDRPVIPIVPTSVAANPDMGVIVHVLGGARAIPVNYKHVVINEAAIEWTNGGQNYPDVVSQAADEAGGKAFTTDFAGPHGGVQNSLPAISDDVLEAIRGAATVGALGEILERTGQFANDADVIRILDDLVPLPEAIDAATWLQCPRCWEGDVDAAAAVDGAAIAARLEAEVNEPRTALRALFGRHSYLTRLYSTLSAEEMTLDPEFAFNRDLADVNNVRTATRFIECDEQGNPQFGSAVVTTESGLSFRLDGGSNPGAIQREQGRTVRGEDTPAAAVVEQLLTAGQPDVEEDRRSELAERYDAPANVTGGSSPGGGGSPAADDDGCAVTGGSSSAVFGLLALLGLARRRRRR